MMNKKYSLFFSILLSANFLHAEMVIDTSFDPDKGFEKSIDVIPEKPKSSSIVAPGVQLSSPVGDNVSGEQKTANVATPAADQKPVSQDQGFKNDNLDAEVPSSESVKPVPSTDMAAPQNVPQEAPKDAVKKEGSEIDYQKQGDTLKNEAAAKADAAPAQSAYYGDSSKEYTETQMVAGEDQNSKEAEDADDMAMMLAAGAAAAAVGIGTLGAAMAKGDLDSLGDKVKDKVQGKGGRSGYKRAAVKAEINKKLQADEEDKLKKLNEKTFGDDEKGKKKSAKNEKKIAATNERIAALKERQDKLDKKLTDKAGKLSKKAKKNVGRYQAAAQEAAGKKSVMKKAKADFDAKQRANAMRAKLPKIFGR